MPNRSISTPVYRFGYQGQESDSEISGAESYLAFTYRVHDVRLGRFLSRDPLSNKYPFYSTYSFSGNRVIDMIELEGLEPIRPKSLTFEEDSFFGMEGETWTFSSFLFEDCANCTDGVQPKLQVIGKSNAVVWEYETIFGMTDRVYENFFEMNWVELEGVYYNATSISNQSITPEELMKQETWEQYWSNQQMVQDALNQNSNKAAMAAGIGSMVNGFRAVINGFKNIMKQRNVNKLISELKANGIKFTEKDIIDIGRDRNGNVVFLETGGATSGWQHILSHADDFVTNGIAKSDIQNHVFNAVTKGKVVGFQNTRQVYEISYKGQKTYVAATVGSNGYIVGANPTNIGNFTPN